MPRSVLFADGEWQGIRSLEGGLGEDPLLAQMRTAATFRPRQEVEEDSAWQQVIPYVAFRHGESHLITKRLGQSSERRLHHLYSVAVGGHINQVDLEATREGSPGDPLLAGLWREWGEEIDYAGTLRLRLLGLLKDDSTPVGRVHVGLVGLMEGDSDNLRLRETEKMEGHLLPLAEMIPYYLNMESWSQLLYDHLRAAS